MSRFFPHPPYAEDQSYPYTILATHVLHRGFQVGALLGATAGLSYSSYRYFRPTTTAAAAVSPTPPFRQTFRALILPNTLRTTGLGATAGLGLLAIGLEARMWGREEIEWQDRAWRLLEHEGQMSVDDWSLAGMAVGVALALLAARRGAIVIKNRPMALVGAAGLGSLAGTEGSVEWRALTRTEVRQEKVGPGSGKRLLEE
ncbi:hypothetical protein GJ744_005497 [Endocarpon pusillum]|uniref:Uncharacterized protein n=1 Tax=Endocarpon pusillum TaxID=364733 RepID=A0A8H7DZJ3_9EURO|nr:hypothetical protein GJ744_005497 [Endocarpon pusillum]